MKAIEKAEAALSLLLQEGVEPSLLEICRMAGINRSNIYEHHPAFVQRIRTLQTNRPDQTRISGNTSSLSNTETQRQISRLKEENKSLLYLCLKLKTEVEDLREQLDMTHPAPKSAQP